jgi:hypothetical protein
MTTRRSLAPHPDLADLPPLTGRSKPRKHGRYWKGRPWPRVCPACRNCGREASPELFYNSRGLCNVCHRSIREEGGHEGLELWENLPPEANDRSFDSLEKDPARWLQKYMTGQYAQPFIDRGPEAVRAEALRIFQSIVDRWYGREEVPSVTYTPTPSYEETAWSYTPWSDQDEPPATTSSGKTVDEQRDDVSVRRTRRADRRRFMRWLGQDLVAFGLIHAGDQIPARVLIDGDEYVVAWSLHEITVMVTGQIEVEGGTIALVHDDQFTNYPYDLDRLGHLLDCLGSG